MYKRFVKNIADSFVALLLLIILLPVFVVITVLLHFTNKGKIFFGQKRPGLNEIAFTLYKFRSMNDNRDISGKLLPDSIRLTPIGKILRRTSLDELPQLWNVLKGDMSFVGPRPLLTEYLPLYDANQKMRHSVKPGITGWAQVNGRNSISWEMKFVYDVWYAKNISFFVDLKILLLTIKKLSTQEGINQIGEATVLPFTGKKNNL